MNRQHWVFCKIPHVEKISSKTTYVYSYNVFGWTITRYFSSATSWVLPNKMAILEVFGLISLALTDPLRFNNLLQVNWINILRQTYLHIFLLHNWNYSFEERYKIMITIWESVEISNFNFCVIFFTAWMCCVKFLEVWNTNRHHSFDYISRWGLELHFIIDELYRTYDKRYTSLSTLTLLRQLGQLQEQYEKELIVVPTLPEGSLFGL